MLCSSFVMTKINKKHAVHQKKNLESFEKNHGQWIERDLWDYLKIYLKNKSQRKADL